MVNLAILVLPTVKKVWLLYGYDREGFLVGGLFRRAICGEEGAAQSQERARWRGGEEC